jgi:aspartyl-tRNA(Asn)/glutamyl-tRNA(Gln) amidotransferase subunit B
MEYDTTIGLEVHVQLKTATKLFCSCAAAFGGAPNTRVCPVCSGQPGVLPVLNRKAVDLAVKAGLALGCTIAPRFHFDRKNYFYPDLPKGYQITQRVTPIASRGFVAVDMAGTQERRFAVRSAHLEEDAGKTIHPAGAAYSLVDLNRAGLPLLEIVSEPVIASPAEAHAYLTALKRLLRYTEVSDCDMEKGSLRCDANISIRPRGEGGLGTRTEIKNLNSFRNVESALACERARHEAILHSGGRVGQETRSWREDRGETAPMRSKEDTGDYRYFPEPDLPPFPLPAAMVQKISAGLPELPLPKKRRIITKYGLDESAAETLSADRRLACFFEECATVCGDGKEAARWILGPVMAAMNSRRATIGELKLTSRGLADLVVLVKEGRLSRQAGRKVLLLMAETGKDAAALAEEACLEQESDGDVLEEIVDTVLTRYPEAAEEFRSGRDAALNALIGRVMKASGGCANPRIVRTLLESKLRSPR